MAKWVKHENSFSRLETIVWQTQCPLCQHFWRFQPHLTDLNSKWDCSVVMEIFYLSSSSILKSCNDNWAISMINKQTASIDKGCDLELTLLLLNYSHMGCFGRHWQIIYSFFRYEDFWACFPTKVVPEHKMVIFHFEDNDRSSIFVCMKSQVKDQRMASSRLSYQLLSYHWV